MNAPVSNDTERGSVTRSASAFAVAHEFVPGRVAGKGAAGHRPALRYGCGFATLAAVAVLFLFNPAGHGFFPPCLFHKLTGLNCPGCGATRAAHELLHGNFAVAFRDNALLVGAVICAALYGLGWMVGRVTPCAPSLDIFRPGAHGVTRPTWLWLALAVMLVFGVGRNLPAGAWLSP